MSKEDSKEPDDKKETPETQLEKLQAEKGEIFDRLQRVSAEFANYQKRSVKQISESIAYEKEHIIKSLLPILDNFEHTFTHLDKASDAAELTKGVRMIYDQFVSILKSHGVEQIIAVGEKFDPAYHQALTQRSEAGKEDMVVLEEYRTGYKLGDKILRPTIVIVNKKAATAPEEKTQEETAPDSGSENGD
ncbi:MAG: nucleotide exchange factor GrpE [Planctomycetes bacterium GWF2_42_9]|nr:MAG: nucleotide exchange factor GrpE [Planctomycetes bacterium GWF2_42_9]HAL45349.1 nucleotide exchange factor GrpE [Phycisphaerales bacterium]